LYTLFYPSLRYYDGRKFIKVEKIKNAYVVAPVLFAIDYVKARYTTINNASPKLA
jgi:hypothetical protein